MPTRKPALPSDAPRPEIIVDFVCEQGLLFVALRNIGNRSAYKVTTVFDKPLYGIEGQKCISEMQLFRRVEFMPPGKEFLQLVDSVGSWFRQKKPARVTADINYRDREGVRFKERIVHDLRIYRDLGYTNLHRSGGDDGQRNP